MPWVSPTTLTLLPRARGGCHWVSLGYNWRHRRTPGPALGSAWQKSLCVSLWSVYAPQVPHVITGSFITITLLKRRRGGGVIWHHLPQLPVLIVFQLIHVYVNLHLLSSGLRARNAFPVHSSPLRPRPSLFYFFRRARPWGPPTLLVPSSESSHLLQPGPPY